jgi:pyruvate/2-oxoglutarate dehydrogenase complex dihydrolipoamide acyltransferase (E2) component
VVAFRAERNGTLDTLRWAKKRHQIPILLEVDVTEARRALHAYGDGSDVRPSFTAWVISCVARAAAEHPRVHSVRHRRRGLVLFDEVDVAVLVERTLEGGADPERLPMPSVIRRADQKSPTEIGAEIRRAREAKITPGSSSIERSVSPRLQALFFRAPAWLRDLLFWRWLVRSPFRIKRTMGTVVVTSVGMAVPGVLAWGIPMSVHPLAVGVGGIARRSDGTEERELLGLTVVFDHEVVDGAPVGRFVHRLHQLMSSCEGLATELHVTHTKADPA